MAKRNHTLLEHEYLSCIDNGDDKNKKISKKIFNELESFVLNNQGEEEDQHDFLYLTQKNGHKILKARNYVGIIQTNSGITIEILPKICGVDRIGETKQIFIKMLRTLKGAPFKQSQKATLNLANMSLLDIFINMFLDELDILVKQGLRRDYVAKSKNIKKLKGKLKFAQNIKHNFVHKENFYCKYDEFNRNRPENRLIKSTLLKLNNKIYSNYIQQRIQRFLFVFNEIDESNNYEIDFENCKNNRLVSHYEQILAWCRVFLQNKTFTNYWGENIALALLFPMERIFEDYFAHKLKRYFNKPLIRVQRKIGSLLQSGRYAMIPDIIMKTENKNIILDTKWKIFTDNISKNDLYQMFAYINKIEAENKKVILVYPQNEYFTKYEPKRHHYKFYNDNQLYVFPFDLKESNLDELDILIRDETVKISNI